MSDGKSLDFGVVLNDLSDEVPFPIDLGHGWVLDRATADEVPLVKEVLAPIALLKDPALPYEASVAVSGGGRFRERAWDLNQTKWRYSVVRRVSVDAGDQHKLVQAFRIAPSDLYLNGWVRVDSGTNGTQQSIDHVVSMHYFERGLALGAPNDIDVDSLARTVNLRYELDEEKFPGIAHAVNLFTQLDQVSDGSDVKFLGHFAVIESLLTHAPDPHDPVDSISRQLKRNLALLDHRMPINQNLELDSFRDCTADQVISRLYSIRSAAAHGGNTQKDVEWLVGRKPGHWGLFDSAHGMVRRMTQRVLLSALVEPQLVTDLKGK